VDSIIKIVIGSCGAEVPEYMHASTYVMEGTDRIALFNDLNSRIEHYDLSKGQCTGYTVIPKALGTVSGAVSISADTTFILTENRLHFVAGDSITSTVQLDKLHSDKGYIYNNINYQNLLYIQHHHALVIPKYSEAFSFDSPRYYSSGIDDIYYPTSNSLNPASITYPDAYTNEFYGFANQVSRSLNDKNQLVYSFAADSRIYVYDIENKTISSFECRSKYQKAEVKGIPKKEKADDQFKMDHLTQIPYYEGLLYDPYRKFYYRFFFKEISLKNADGTYNEFSDKEEFLMIIDSSFNVIEEVRLEKNKYNTSCSYVVQDGLIISTAHYKNKDDYGKNLSFYLFKMR